MEIYKLGLKGFFSVTIVQSICILIFTATSLLLSYAGCYSANNISKTGQNISYATGDDGDRGAGVSWPVPRFSDNGNGTVTDNLTMLVWLKTGNCGGAGSWGNVLDGAANLETGECGLTDGSIPGIWRVPNVRELESLMHSGVWSPAIPDTQGSGSGTQNNPFTNLQQAPYWSSTSLSGSENSAFYVEFQRGVLGEHTKVTTNYSLFVRGGSSSSAEAPLPRTGQSLCYSNDGNTRSCDETGQDGEYQKGNVWPAPRFTDNTNGTVTDNLSGLVWLKNANCRGLSSWSGAVNSANSLASGSCGLSDNSEPGDWRLPNRRELHSLIHFGESSPAISNTNGSGKWSPNDPFINVQTTSGYWTSTTYTPFSSSAWFVHMGSGKIADYPKRWGVYSWPVRDDLIETLTVGLGGNGTGRVISSPEGIDCPGKCSAEFAKMTAVTLRAIPGEYSLFEGWSNTGCGRSMTCNITLNSSKSVEAVFYGNAVLSWTILLLGE